MKPLLQPTVANEAAKDNAVVPSQLALLLKLTLTLAQATFFLFALLLGKSYFLIFCLVWAKRNTPKTKLQHTAMT